MSLPYPHLIILKYSSPHGTIQEADCSKYYVRVRHNGSFNMNCKSFYFCPSALNTQHDQFLELNFQKAACCSSQYREHQIGLIPDKNRQNVCVASVGRSCKKCVGVYVRSLCASSDILRTKIFCDGCVVRCQWTVLTKTTLCATHIPARDSI